MSFRLIAYLTSDRSPPGISECALASDAFTIYRRLARARLHVERILDLRDGNERSISAAELEAIAQRERFHREESVTAE